MFREFFFFKFTILQIFCFSRSCFFSWMGGWVGWCVHYASSTHAENENEMRLNSLNFLYFVKYFFFCVAASSWCNCCCCFSFHVAFLRNVQWIFCIIIIECILCTYVCMWIFYVMFLCAYVCVCIYEDMCRWGGYVYDLELKVDDF